MIYKTLTEIRQSELNADCGKGFSRCCLTEQDSYTGRTPVFRPCGKVLIAKGFRLVRDRL